MLLFCTTHLVRLQEKCSYQLVSTQVIIIISNQLDTFFHLHFLVGCNLAMPRVRPKPGVQ